MELTTKIFISNPHAGGTVLFPNTTGINIPAERPTIEDMNRILRPSEQEVSPDRGEPNQSNALFGTHIREGIAIVKDWVGSRSK
jgi:hypothetical protein